MPLMQPKFCLLLILFVVTPAVLLSQNNDFSLRTLDSLNAFDPRHNKEISTKTPGFNEPANRTFQNLSDQLISRILNTQTSNCFDTARRIFIENDTLRLYINNPILTADGNLLVPGEVVFRSLPNFPNKGFLMKMDLKGNMIWFRNYDSLNHIQYHFLNYYRVIELSNGNILMAGSTNNRVTGNTDLVLTNTDPQGNIIWSKIYKSRFWLPGGTGSRDYYYVQQMKEDPWTGDVFISGPLWALGRSLIKLNPNNGNITWSKLYDHSGTSFDRAFGFHIKQNELVYFGKIISSNSSIINIHRINKVTGDTIQSKYYYPNDPLGTKGQILTTEPLQVTSLGNYLVGGKSYGYYQYQWNGTTPLYQAAVAEFDSNLNFVRSYVFKSYYESNGNSSRVSFFPDGSGMFTMLDYISGFSGIIYYIQFKDGQILKQRKRAFTNEGMPYEPNAIKTPSGGDLTFKVLGDSAAGIARNELLEIYPSDTSSACIGVDDVGTSVQSFSYVPNPGYQITSIESDVFQENPNKTFTISNSGATTAPACYAVSYCDTLSLVTSSTAICVGGNVQIVARKNPECGSNISLHCNSSAITSVVQMNDSTTSFTFNAAWSGYIYGSLQGCDLLEDSVFIRVLAAPGAVNLGADTMICPGNTIRLSAGDSYATYQWQDGSADSVLIVTQPGNYYVQVTDACGAVYQDTISVLSHPPIPFDAGPDRSKCNSDTLQLHAPSGFLTYTWTPVYNISNTSTATVIVNPLTDTSYYIKAEKSPGCFAYDTIRISVFNSPTINLGTDTSFCFGDSTILNAGTGFVSYSWSTGSVQQQISVRQQGIYSVLVTTVDGCASTDTIQVQNIWDLPTLQLDTSPELCIGTTRILDPGSFNSYLWQDGSTSRSFMISDTGKYHVRVIDDNQCINSDTVQINTLLSPPSNFLPDDTSLCSYSSINLSPILTFSRYVWSTGSINPTITVSVPGNYWLQVTDIKGCTGRDSILISARECMIGVYIPNAFTPNNDGKNDIFRALVFGPVKNFELSVFNRWGERIFFTKDPAQGWNGKIKDKLPQTDVYVWLCKYEMDDKPYIEKGTLSIIR